MAKVGRVRLVQPSPRGASRRRVKSVLKRRHRLSRCLYWGLEQVERRAGWSAVAHNLREIAEVTASLDAGVLTRSCRHDRPGHMAITKRLWHREDESQSWLLQGARRSR